MNSLHKVIAVALFMGATGVALPSIAVAADTNAPAATDTKADAKKADAKTDAKADTKTADADKAPAKKGKKVAKTDAKADAKDAKADDKTDAKTADADKAPAKKAKKVVKKEAKPENKEAAKDEPKKDDKAATDEPKPAKEKGHVVAAKVTKKDIKAAAGGGESEVQKTADLNKQALVNATTPVAK